MRLTVSRSPARRRIPKDKRHREGDTVRGECHRTVSKSLRVSPEDGDLSVRCPGSQGRGIPCHVMGAQECMASSHEQETERRQLCEDTHPSRQEETGRDNRWRREAAEVVGSTV